LIVYFELKELIVINDKTVTSLTIKGWKIVNLRIMLSVSVMLYDIQLQCGKTFINSHTQSGGTGVRTLVMMSGLTISTYLPVELGFMGLIQTHSNLN
jgi:hypothetical protein